MKQTDTERYGAEVASYLAQAENDRILREREERNREQNIEYAEKLKKELKITLRENLGNAISPISARINTAHSLEGGNLFENPSKVTFDLVIETLYKIFTGRAYEMKEEDFKIDLTSIKEEQAAQWLSKEISAIDDKKREERRDAKSRYAKYGL